MNSLKKMFWQGRIGESFIELTGLDPQVDSHSKALACAPESIGVFVFKGDFERADILFKELKKSLTPEQMAGGLFYLIIGLIRKSEYKKSVHLLKELKSIYLLYPTDERVRFYFSQGLAFYAYYRSDFSRCHVWAKRALTSSLKSSFEFGELMARDLLGGAMISEGQISQGLKELKQSLAVALKIGNGGFVSALKVSVVGFESRYGRLVSPIEVLEENLESLSVEDTYSLSDLKLELARQLILQGQAQRAERLLNECSSLIYSNQNQRQAATLHHRLAFLMYAKGQFQQALTLLQVAEQSLNPKLDYVYLGRLQGLKFLILKKLGLNLPEALELPSDSVHQRIEGRVRGVMSLTRQGEDPLGDHIDFIFDQKRGQRFEKIKKIVDEKLWYFLPEVLDCDRQKEHMIFGLDGPSITLLSKGEVVHISKSARGLSEKFLLQVHKKHQTKEQLIQKIWGYEYDPLRHDPLVYSLVAQMRKQFGPFSKWLQMSDEGYSLDANIELLDLRSKNLSAQSGASKDLKIEPTESTGLAQENLSEHFIDPNFNFRQNEWMRKNSELKHFSISDYKKHFEISTMTAFRDIDQLAKAKWIKRSGFGRSTRYHFLLRFEA